VTRARPPAPDELAIEPLGDGALLVRFGERIDAETNGWVHALADALRVRELPWLLDLVPAYAALALHFDAAAFDPREDAHAHAAQVLRAAWATSSCTQPHAGRLVEIGVRYGGADGPDLAEVAQHAGLTVAEVVRRHAAPEYRVAMLGFAPGFPYLSGLDPALATPRLAQPRLRLEAGSVAIGGAQTGIYPQAGPGGWRVIGRTAARLFDPAREPASLLQPGDRVRFVAEPAA
jgi:KipI family sensor histidine kinase inhibitor